MQQTIDEFGIVNEGATCYLNSSFQGLIHTQAFRSILLNEEAPNLIEMSKLFKTSTKIKSLSVFINKFIRPIEKKKFQLNVQIDPTEALTEIIWSLPNLIRNTCFQYSYKISNIERDKMDVIPCRIRDKTLMSKSFVDIQASIDFQLKDYKFFKTPKIMIFSLSRYKSPTEVDESSISSNKYLQIKENDIPSTFELRSIICRTGNLSFAHVFTIAQNNNQWIYLNDDTTAPVSTNPTQFQKYIETKSYIYIYEKISGEDINLSERYITFSKKLENSNESTINLPGIKNLGSTCWMNCILQNLFHFATFVKCIKTTRINDSMIIELRSLYEQMINSTQPVIPDRFMSIMNHIFSAKNECENYSSKYHDIVEYLVKLDHSFSFMMIPLQIKYKSTTKILNTVLEQTSSITLDIDSGNFEQAVFTYFSPQTIAYNENESSKVNATKIYSLEYLPQMLTFEIRRAYYDNIGVLSLNKKKFDYPKRFKIKDECGNIGCYCIHSAVFYSGLPDKGHFIISICDEEEVTYNDSNVQKGFKKEDEQFHVTVIHYKYELETDGSYLNMTNLGNLTNSSSTNNENDSNDEKANFITINIHDEKSLKEFFNDTENLNLESFEEIQESSNKNKEMSLPIESLLYKDKQRGKKVIPSKGLKIHRTYHKLDEKERESLSRLYKIHRDSWTPKEYAINTNISLKSMYRYLSELKNGTFDTNVAPHKGGRKSRVTFEYSQKIVNILKEDPQRSLQKIAQILKDENNKLENPEVENKLPTRRSIQRFFKSERCIDFIGSTMSFKKIYTRIPNSNNPENLLLRKERISELREYMQAGYAWVAIDETHWNVDFICRKCKKGWCKTNEKAVIETKRTSFVATAITAITYSGKTFCILVKGNVDKGIFNAFLFQMLNAFQEEKNLVLWLDNCGVHNDTRDAIEKLGHKVVFNAPGSPELNPIENIFGIWKNNVESSGKQWDEETNLIEVIREEFMKLDVILIRSVMENVKGEGWLKAYNLLPQ